jgi:hypothetical protein|nr:MAG TPA: RNA polymerase [Caudoviricetes sp.]
MYNENDENQQDYNKPTSKNIDSSISLMNTLSDAFKQNGGVPQQLENSTVRNFFNTNYAPIFKPANQIKAESATDAVKRKEESLGIISTPEDDAAARIAADATYASKYQQLELNEQRLDLISQKNKQDLDNAEHMNKLKLLDALSPQALADIGYGSKGSYSMSPEERAAYVRKMTADPYKQAMQLAEIKATDDRLKAARGLTIINDLNDRFKIEQQREALNDEKDKLTTDLVALASYNNYMKRINPADTSTTFETGNPLEKNPDYSITANIADQWGEFYRDTLGVGQLASEGASDLAKLAVRKAQNWNKPVSDIATEVLQEDYELNKQRQAGKSTGHPIDDLLAGAIRDSGKAAKDRNAVNRFTTELMKADYDASDGALSTVKNIGGDLLGASGQFIAGSTPEVLSALVPGGLVNKATEKAAAKYGEKVAMEAAGKDLINATRTTTEALDKLKSTAPKAMTDKVTAEVPKRNELFKAMQDKFNQDFRAIKESTDLTRKEKLDKLKALRRQRNVELTSTENNNLIKVYAKATDAEKARMLSTYKESLKENGFKEANAAAFRSEYAANKALHTNAISKVEEANKKLADTIEKYHIDPNTQTISDKGKELLGKEFAAEFQANSKRYSSLANAFRTLTPTAVVVAERNARQAMANRLGIDERDLVQVVDSGDFISNMPLAYVYSALNTLEATNLLEGAFKGAGLKDIFSTTKKFLTGVDDTAIAATKQATKEAASKTMKERATELATRLKDKPLKEVRDITTKMFGLASKTLKSTAKVAGKRGLYGFANEGTAEFLQEYSEQLQQKGFNLQEILNPQTFEQAKEAGLIGGLTGGTTGTLSTGSHLVRNVYEKGIKPLATSLKDKWLEHKEAKADEKTEATRTKTNYEASHNDDGSVIANTASPAKVIEDSLNTNLNNSTIKKTASEAQIRQAKKNQDFFNSNKAKTKEDIDRHTDDLMQEYKYTPEQRPEVRDAVVNTAVSRNNVDYTTDELKDLGANDETIARYGNINKQIQDTLTDNYKVADVTKDWNIPTDKLTEIQDFIPSLDKLDKDTFKDLTNEQKALVLDVLNNKNVKAKTEDITGRVYTPSFSTDENPVKLRVEHRLTDDGDLDLSDFAERAKNLNKVFNYNADTKKKITSTDAYYGLNELSFLLTNANSNNIATKEEDITSIENNSLLKSLHNIGDALGKGDISQLGNNDKNVLEALKNLIKDGAVKNNAEQIVSLGSAERLLEEIQIAAKPNIDTTTPTPKIEANPKFKDQGSQAIEKVRHSQDNAVDTQAAEFVMKALGVADIADAKSINIRVMRSDTAINMENMSSDIASDAVRIVNKLKSVLNDIMLTRAEKAKAYRALMRQLKDLTIRVNSKSAAIHRVQNDKDFLRDIYTDLQNKYNKEDNKEKDFESTYILGSEGFKSLVIKIPYTHPKGTKTLIDFSPKELSKNLDLKLTPVQKFTRGNKRPTIQDVNDYNNKYSDGTSYYLVVPLQETTGTVTVDTDPDSALGVLKSAIDNDSNVLSDALKVFHTAISNYQNTTLGTFLDPKAIDDNNAIYDLLRQNDRIAIKTDQEIEALKAKYKNAKTSEAEKSELLKELSTYITPIVDNSGKVVRDANGETQYRRITKADINQNIQAFMNSSIQSMALSQKRMLALRTILKNPVPAVSDRFKSLIPELADIQVLDSPSIIVKLRDIYEWYKRDLEIAKAQMAYLLSDNPDERARLMLAMKYVEQETVRKELNNLSQSEFNKIRMQGYSQWSDKFKVMLRNFYGFNKSIEYTEQQFNSKLDEVNATRKARDLPKITLEEIQTMTKPLLDDFSPVSIISNMQSLMSIAASKELAKGFKLSNNTLMDLLDDSKIDIDKSGTLDFDRNLIGYAYDFNPLEAKGFKYFTKGDNTPIDSLKLGKLSYSDFKAKLKDSLINNVKNFEKMPEGLFNDVFIFDNEGQIVKVKEPYARAMFMSLMETLTKGANPSPITLGSAESLASKIAKYRENSTVSAAYQALRTTDNIINILGLTPNNHRTISELTAIRNQLAMFNQAMIEGVLINLDESSGILRDDNKKNFFLDKTIFNNIDSQVDKLIREQVFESKVQGVNYFSDAILKTQFNINHAPLKEYAARDQQEAIVANALAPRYFDKERMTNSIKAWKNPEIFASELKQELKDDMIALEIDKSLGEKLAQFAEQIKIPKGDIESWVNKVLAGFETKNYSSNNPARALYLDETLPKILNTIEDYRQVLAKFNSDSVKDNLPEYTVWNTSVNERMSVVGIMNQQANKKLRALYKKIQDEAKADELIKTMYGLSNDTNNELFNMMGNHKDYSQQFIENYGLATEYSEYVKFDDETTLEKDKKFYQLVQDFEADTKKLQNQGLSEDEYNTQFAILQAGFEKDKALIESSINDIFERKVQKNLKKVKVKLHNLKTKYIDGTKTDLEVLEKLTKAEVVEEYLGEKGILTTSNKLALIKAARLYNDKMDFDKFNEALKALANIEIDGQSFGPVARQAVESMNIYTTQVARAAGVSLGKILPNMLLQDVYKATGESVFRAMYKNELNNVILTNKEITDPKDIVQVRKVFLDKLVNIALDKFRLSNKDTSPKIMKTMESIVRLMLTKAINSIKDPDIILNQKLTDIMPSMIKDLRSISKPILQLFNYGSGLRNNASGFVFSFFEDSLLKILDKAYTNGEHLHSSKYSNMTDIFDDNELAVLTILGIENFNDLSEYIDTKKTAFNTAKLDLALKNVGELMESTVGTALNDILPYQTELSNTYLDIAKSYFQLFCGALANELKLDIKDVLGNFTDDNGKLLYGFKISGIYKEDFSKAIKKLLKDERTRNFAGIFIKSFIGDDADIDEATLMSFFSKVSTKSGSDGYTSLATKAKGNDVYLVFTDKAVLTNLGQSIDARIMARVQKKLIDGGIIYGENNFDAITTDPRFHPLISRMMNEALGEIILNYKTDNWGYNLLSMAKDLLTEKSTLTDINHNDKFDMGSYLEDLQRRAKIAKQNIINTANDIRIYGMTVDNFSIRYKDGTTAYKYRPTAEESKEALKRSLHLQTAQLTPAASNINFQVNYFLRDLLNIPSLLESKNSAAIAVREKAVKSFITLIDLMPFIHSDMQKFRDMLTSKLDGESLKKLNYTNLLNAMGEIPNIKTLLDSLMQEFFNFQSQLAIDSSKVYSPYSPMFRDTEQSYWASRASMNGIYKINPLLETNRFHINSDRARRIANEFNPTENIYDISIENVNNKPMVVLTNANGDKVTLDTKGLHKVSKDGKVISNPLVMSANVIGMNKEIADRIKTEGQESETQAMLNNFKDKGFTVISLVANPNDFLETGNTHNPTNANADNLINAFLNATSAERVFSLAEIYKRLQNIAPATIDAFNAKAPSKLLNSNEFKSKFVNSQEARPQWNSVDELLNFINNYREASIYTNIQSYNDGIDITPENYAKSLENASISKAVEKSGGKIVEAVKSLQKPSPSDNMDTNVASDNYDIKTPIDNRIKKGSPDTALDDSDEAINKLTNQLELLYSADDNTSVADAMIELGREYNISNAQIDFSVSMINNLIAPKDQARFFKDSLKVYISRDANSNTSGTFTFSPTKDLDRIYLNAGKTSAAGNNIVETYLHELIHSIIEHAISEGNQEVISAMNKVEQLRDTFLKTLKTTDDKLLLANELGIQGSNEFKLEVIQKSYIDYMSENPNEFITIGLSNPTIFARLKAIEVSKPYEGIIDTIIQAVKNALDAIMNRPLNISQTSNTAAEALYKLTQTIAKNNNKLYDAYVSARKKTLLQKVVNTLDKASNTMVSRWVDDKKIKLLTSNKPDSTSRFKNLIALCKILPFALKNPVLGKQAREYMGNAFNLGWGGFISQTFSSMTSLDDYKRTVNTLIAESQDNDKNRILTFNALQKQLKDAFKTEISDENAKSLGRVILTNDLISIFPTAKEFYIEYSSLNKKDRDAKIDKSIKDASIRLREFAYFKNGKYNLGLHQFYINQATLLGESIATGEYNYNQATNAQNIALGLNYPGVKRGTALEPRDDHRDELIHLLDKIATLSALKHTDENAIADFNYLYNTERDGVENIFTMQKVYAKGLEDELKLQNSDVSNKIKGYTRSISNRAVDVQIARLIDRDDMLKQGYELVQEYNGIGVDRDALGMYVSRTNVKPAYNRGVFRTTGGSNRGLTITSSVDYLLEGKSLDEKNAYIQNILRRIQQGKINGKFVPIYDARGVVIDYRMMIPQAIKEQLEFTDTNVFNVIPTMVARYWDKTESDAFNKKALNELHSMWLKDKNTDNFIYLGAEDMEIMNRASNGKSRIKPKDLEKLKESWDLLPQSTKAYIYEQFPDMHHGIYIREDLLASIAGSRDIRLTESEAFKRIVPDKAHQHLANLVEFGIIKLAKQIRQKLVVKNPEVILGNIASNQYILTSYGITPMQTAKYFGEGIDLIDKYNRDNEAYLSAYRAYKLSNNDLRLKRKYEVYLKAMQDNPIYEFDKRGLISDITDELPSQNDMDKDFIDKKLTETADKLAIPQAFRDAFDVLMVNEGTQLHKAYSTVIKYSDLLARYSLWKHLMANKGKDDSTIKTDTEIWDLLDKAFINYSTQDHPYLKYANDIGFARFTKYWIRAQNYIANGLLGTKLATTMLSLATQAMTGIKIESPLNVILGKKLFGYHTFTLPLVDDIAEIVADPINLDNPLQYINSYFK